ncbi:glycosyltransferase family 9 protein [Actinoallomurus soli]|uniref:glycosyltransferase family 9 protein n=1 Tax=Actinoallomurus soli TaxID=2952535 RepID=UPI002092819C|nr:glycosyltransferase family 9 protein [Actinoallomurus soli]MCO5970800.1 glycosyltransferase family 9 protein [Actinoallomurus soli]
MTAVLMLRALGLGDFLTGVPAYRALRRAYAGAETVLAAPAALRPLVALTGAIDRLLPTGELRPIPWQGPPPEVAVDLHGNGPASHALIDATRARLRMMYASPTAPGVDGPWWDDDEHEVVRWCRLVGRWGIPADPGDLRLRAPVEEPPVRRAAVVHPGAAYPARRWPPDRFAAVARALAAEGHPVVITGTAGERDLAAAVAGRAGLPAGAVLAGTTGLEGLAALVADAAVVVSNDTGLSHLATAYGVPSVTLFGPVSPALWGPPEDGPHVALWHGSGGRPGNAHGTETDPRLLRITVDEVLAALTALRQPAA